MSLRTITVILWGCLIATAAIAGEEHRMKVEIAVDGEDHKVFEWHGDGTTLDDLEVGESKTITDDDGNVYTGESENDAKLRGNGRKLDLLLDTAQYHADAQAMAEGTLDPMAAFMQGKIMVAGDMALMMQMQAIQMQAAAQAALIQREYHLNTLRP